MARTAVLGFPRIGADRELKLALEAHWSGRMTADELEAVARDLRAANLRRGPDVVPVGDFALYDHVLDAAELVGIVAPRHRGAAPFAACRGAEGVTPLEMTKWFDTNYHYLVPELEPGQALRVARREVARAPGGGARARRARPPGRARPVLGAAAVRRASTTRWHCCRR